jgi:hypothetical protein
VRGLASVPQNRARGLLARIQRRGCMTIADYIFAACMTVVIVWIVAEGDRRGPFQKFGRDK